MKALMKTTKPATPATVEKKWILIDAEGLVVGRLASTVAGVAGLVVFISAFMVLMLRMKKGTGRRCRHPEVGR